MTCEIALIVFQVSTACALSLKCVMCVRENGFPLSLSNALLFGQLIREIGTKMSDCRPFCTRDEGSGMVMAVI